MAQPMNHLEIYQHLNKSNCHKCDMPTCLAFAVAVARGEAPLSSCPYVQESILNKYGEIEKKQDSIETDIETILIDWQQKVKNLDFNKTAQRLGLPLVNNNIVVSIMGKPFTVTPEAQIQANCHVNPFLSVVLFSYLSQSKGLTPENKWVSIKELKHGMDWTRLFGQRAEKPLKKFLDDYFYLFDFMADVFQGKDVTQEFSSDKSVIFYPLPNVPMLINYWKPEDGLDSNFSLLFDKTASDNLGMESVYWLGAGLATMFERIAITHGR